MPSPAHCTKLVCKPHGPHVSPFGWGTPDGCGNVRGSTTTLEFFAALFYLDALGYIVLTAALYHPAFARYRRLTRWALIALTAATIVAYFALIQGQYDAIGIADKIAEVVLIALLVVEGRRDRLAAEVPGI